jgi:hypothetical protein
MEDFFTPSRRLQDLYGDINDEYTEVHLSVSVETFLNHSWDWSDLCAFATDDEAAMWKIMWITGDTMIWVEDENTPMNFEHILEDEYQIWRAAFTATSGETRVLVLATDMESASLSAQASSFFWHALTTRNCVDLKLKQKYWSNWRNGLCSGHALLQFLEASPSL